MAENKNQLKKGIKMNSDMIKGIRNSLESRLLLSHSASYVKDIIDKIDLIIELATEMGIDISRSGIDEVVKNNLFEARTKRREQVDEYSQFNW